MADLTTKTTYSNARYGVVQRQFALPLTKADVGTAGTTLESFITLPYKSKIVAFGIQSVTSDVVLAAADYFELRTHNGTKLATLVIAGTYTLATGCATCCAPETATTIAKNTSMVGCVGSTVGTSGSVYFFVDYSPEIQGC